MKLIVLNLDRTITESELAEEFKKFGEVKSCNLVLDKVTGSSKGFGFVEMSDTVSAQAAITALHGQKLRKSKIRVKEAKDKDKPA